eukprot:UN05031
MVFECIDTNMKYLNNKGKLLCTERNESTFFVEADVKWKGMNFAVTEFQKWDDYEKVMQMDHSLYFDCSYRESRRLVRQFQESFDV